MSCPLKFIASTALLHETNLNKNTYLIVQLIIWKWPSVKQQQMAIFQINYALVNLTIFFSLQLDVDSSVIVLDICSKYNLYIIWKWK